PSTRVGFAERDQLRRELAVEKQVRQEIRFFHALAPSEPPEGSAREPLAAPCERGSSDEVAAEQADVLRCADDDGLQVPQSGLSLGDAELTIDGVDEARAVFPRAGGEEFVDARQALDVAVEAVEEECVQRLAEQERGAGKRLLPFRLEHRVRLLRTDVVR